MLYTIFNSQNVLNKICDDVLNINEEVKPYLQEAVMEMQENRGVAIAAPQIGVLYSPVLDYLQCHDNLQDNRNRTQTDYILSLIDGGDNPSTELVAKQLELRLKYEEAEMKLDKLEGCPTLPS